MKRRFYGTCPSTGKRIFTRSEASRTARWFWRERFARMEHYRCPSCHGWHTGNTRRKPRTRR